MDSLNDNKQFWEQAWADGRTRFHRQEANPALLQHAARAFAPGSRLLIPLCGKSLDLLWLADRGYGVVGVEVATQAVQEFILENHLAGSWEDNHFQVKGQRLCLINQDFFHHDGRYEGIYDRACMVALPKALRKRMAERYKSLLMPQGKILLVTLTHSLGDGPPYSVEQAEIEELFSDSFEIEFLTTRIEGERTVEVRLLSLC